MAVAVLATVNTRPGALHVVTGCLEVVGTAMFYKPDDYFAAGGWRGEPGGGPILINVIHEVNNLLSLVGDINRGVREVLERHPDFPVEDTTATPR